MPGDADPIRLALRWLDIPFSDTRQPTAHDGPEQRKGSVGGGLIGRSQDDPHAASRDDEAEDELTEEKYQRPPGLRLLIGVEADHDDELAQDFLEGLFAWVQSYHHAPLLSKDIRHDCMVAPPERGGKHWEVIRFMW